MDAVSVSQTDVFAAAVEFARVEGILPAPESSHTIRVAIDEALKCKQTGEKKKIVFCLTGTGYFDLKAYSAYNNNTMTPSIIGQKEGVFLISFIEKPAKTSHCQALFWPMTQRLGCSV